MLYKFAKVLFYIYFFIFNKVTVRGTDNIPDTGGFVLCSNHIHWLDPLLMGCYVKRNIYFMAKAELFKSKFFAIILKGIHAFPVKRGTGDISAIKKSLKTIKNGHVLGIFPEGHRSKDGNLMPPEPGVGLIALKTQAPVIPMRIRGNYRPGGKLFINIGKPIEFNEYNSKKQSSEEMNKVSQIIMDEIAKLV